MTVEGKEVPPKQTSERQRGKLEKPGINLWKRNAAESTADSLFVEVAPDFHPYNLEFGCFTHSAYLAHAIENITVTQKRFLSNVLDHAHVKKWSNHSSTIPPLSPPLAHNRVNPAQGNCCPATTLIASRLRSHTKTKYLTRKPRTTSNNVTLTRIAKINIG